jgi:16S rRNA processing protein RimM
MMSSPTAVRSSFIAVGRVIRPHGVRGALQVEAISDLLLGLQPGTEVTFGENHWTSKLVFLHPHRKRYLMAVEDCTDRRQAEALRGDRIYLPAAAADRLPEGTYFHHQILGLAVETEEGVPLGTVEDILETGANDVYVVRSEAEGELLLPAIDSVIRKIDLDSGVLIVRLLPGLRSS